MKVSRAPSSRPDVHGPILTEAAVGFVADLVARFRPEVEARLAQRVEAQAKFEAEGGPDFLPQTAEIRAGDWRAAPMPAALADRRVEITGPVDRKMIINALNSGANMFMADFEDSTAPSWDNVLDGQVNLRDAVAGDIHFFDDARQKDYRLQEQTATLLVRPRGWHLLEKNLLVDGAPAPAGLVDFGFYFFHNARALLAAGKGPYFYLPKLQSHLEARLWNDVFNFAQDALDIPRGSIKATVLIETLPAVFEMHEILYELREHSSGLNCGRWDYIFSYIKTFKNDASRVLPDRAVVGMTQPFMSAYSQLLIQTCHRRGVHAMGGMAAQIPIKNDPAANAAALDKVRADKLREVQNGHDGTWVAHPGLVPIAKEIFDAHMPAPNQIDNLREDVSVTRAELLEAPTGVRTEQGLRQNVNVGVLYLEAWLGGTGCVPLYNLMEDAATAEISRTQVWQWIRHGAKLDDGRVVDRDLTHRILDEEMSAIREMVGPQRFETGKFAEARALFESLATGDTCPDFLTLPAYDRLIEST